MYIQNDEAQYGTGLILNECNYNVFLHKYVVCIKATVLSSFCKGKDVLISILVLEITYAHLNFFSFLGYSLWL
jgi:hypothetical protein